MAIDTTVAWPTFQEVDERESGREVEDTGSVAEDILDSFGIPMVGGGGGSLLNVDIKRADAMSTLKASLLETYATSRGSYLKEIRINPDGEAEFYDVGKNSASLSELYYTIASHTYIKDPEKVSVMVTGAKPKQERILYEWYEIIGDNAVDRTIYDTSAMATACLSNSFSTHATITYRDPLRTNPSNNWNNGLADIGFELTSPYDRFLGFSWRITPPPGEVSPFTKIHRQTQSSIPVLLSDAEYSIGDSSNFPNLGTLLKRRLYTKQTLEERESVECKIYEGDVEYCGETTVPLNLVMNEGLTHEIKRGVAVSKFLELTGVFVVGIPLITCHGIPKAGQQKADNTAANTNLFIGAQNTYNTLVKLNQGIHYTVLYKKDLNASDITSDISPKDYLPCIQFANNLRSNDYANVGGGVQFYIGTQSTELLLVFGSADDAEFVAMGSVLPLENRSGILVEQVWAQVSLDTHCFVVNDPAGNAKRIAEGLKVEVLGLALRDEPAPIAMNGILITQDADLVDNDPTTVQDLQTTAMEQAYEAMSSGRTMSLNFSSLDESKTTILSEKLYDLLRADTGKVYTHTCGPMEKVEVGERGPNKGIINTIEYAYTDQGSYLITVTEGPENFGDFAGIDGGIYYKQTEEVTTKGTIIQDKGNHVDYKVRVDGYGDISAINGCAEVLAVRDRVSITIHNNEVES